MTVRLCAAGQRRRLPGSDSAHIPREGGSNLARSVSAACLFESAPTVLYIQCADMQKYTEVGSLYTSRELHCICKENHQKMR